MDLEPFLDNLRRELATAAAAGGAEARALAERLSAALDSAARLALLESLSAAADEITRDLAPGSVEVRLRGRDPEFVVTPPPDDEPVGPPSGAEATLRRALARRAEGQPPLPPAPPVPPEPDDPGGTSRITLRLPEHLKPRIDAAAGQAGLSVNSWLVRAVAAALEPEDRVPRPGGDTGRPFGRGYTGWVR
jgi:hypothetical protein